MAMSVRAVAPLVMLLLASLLTPCARSESTFVYDVASTVEISRWSGAIALMSNITVHNAAATPLSLDKLRLGIPGDFIDSVIYARVEAEGAVLPLAKDGNWFAAKLPSSVTLGPGDALKAQAIFVMVGMVGELNETSATVNVVLRPLVDGLVKNFTVEIVYPSGVEPLEIPEGFTKAPNALRYETSDVSGTEEAVMNVTLTTLAPNRGLYLLFASIRRHVELEPGGVVRISDTIVVRNDGPTTFPRTERLEYRLPEGASEACAESVLGRRLGSAAAGAETLEFALPFDLHPGEKATVVVKYSVRTHPELAAPWVLSVSVDSNLLPPLDMVILDFSVTASAPLAFEAEALTGRYFNVTRFHVVPLAASAKFPLLAIAVPAPGLTSYLAVGLAAALALTRLKPVLFTKPLPPELAEWAERALEEVEALAAILSLRRKYRRGEVAYDHYVKETRHLAKQAKSARASATKLEKTPPVASWEGLSRVRRLRRELDAVDKEWHAVSRLLAQRKIARDEAKKRWGSLEDREESLIAELRDILRSVLG